MTKRYLAFLAGLAVASLPSVAQAQKVGPQFPVSQYTRAAPAFPDVASDSAGNFMVVWQNTGYYGNGILGRPYDSEGNPLNGEFHITTSQSNSHIASTNNNFVIVWQDEGSGYGRILGHRYDGHGNPLGGEFQVNSYATNGQGAPAVASDASGNFVVVWGGGWGRRFDSDGNPLGDDFRMKGPGGFVASDADGNFVVVWTPVGGNVLGQRYDNTGRPVGDTFQVNTYTKDNQLARSVAATPDGHFLVVWQSIDTVREGSDDDGWGVYGQLYDPTGTPVGENFQVNQYTPCWQWNPDVTVDKDGNFVVAWQNFLSCDGIFGRRYDVQGRPLTNEFQVNTANVGYAGHPAVASASSGSFVVVWDTLDRYSRYGYGIFGQRFSTDCQASLAVEGDVQPPGGTLRAQVHIAHHRPKTVTVPWELRLLDANGQRIVRHTTEPHTFKPGDVVDRSVELRLPEDLAAGTYMLELAISGMAGTRGATTSIRVVRAE